MRQPEGQLRLSRTGWIGGEASFRRRLAVARESLEGALPVAEGHARSKTSNVPRPSSMPGSPTTTPSGSTRRSGTCRRLDRTGRLSILKHRYPVGRHLAGRRVSVDSNDGLLQISHDGVLVVSHERRHLADDDARMDRRAGLATRSGTDGARSCLPSSRINYNPTRLPLPGYPGLERPRPEGPRSLPASIRDEWPLPGRGRSSGDSVDPGRRPSALSRGISPRDLWTCSRYTLTSRIW
jgi:hypothetical protein